MPLTHVVSLVQVKVPSYGCDCYAYGLLACGFVDVVVEATMQPYDYMALIPVVEGAGGKVSDWQVRPHVSHTSEGCSLALSGR